MITRNNVECKWDVFATNNICSININCVVFVKVSLIHIPWNWTGQYEFPVCLLFLAFFQKKIMPDFFTT